jgi:hypothetical protein
MFFVLCPYSRFPVQCSVSYNNGPLVKQPLDYY